MVRVLCCVCREGGSPAAGGPLTRLTRHTRLGLGGRDKKLEIGSGDQVGTGGRKGAGVVGFVAGEALL